MVSAPAVTVTFPAPISDAPETIGLFSNLAAVSVPAIIQAVRTGGYSSIGVGSALYVYDAAVNAAFVTANPRVSFLSADGRGFRLSTDQALNLSMFGADPTGAAYSDVAWASMIAFVDAYKVNSLESGRYFGTRSLLIPAGSYKFANRIELKNATYLIRGDGNGMAGGVATVLTFEGDHGFIIHKQNTTGETSGPNTTGADGTIIEGLKIQASGATGHGIWARSRFRTNNVWIQGFGGNGYNIAATAGGGGAAEGNANDWRIDGGRVSNCTGHGLYVGGADANAGLAEGLDLTANGGKGLLDESFLGNTYVALHTATNAGGPYSCTNNNARSLLLNCYSESDQTTSIVNYPSQVVGGLHAAGMSGTAPWLTTNSFGHLVVANGFNAGAGAIDVRLGGDNAALQAMRVGYPTGNLRLLMEAGGLTWRRNGAALAASVVTHDATTLQFGRSAIVPDVFYTPTHAVGSSSATARIQDYGTAAPATGAHAQGEIVWNSAPAAAGTLGWVCVTAGTPGTWKAISGIAA